MNFDWLTAVAVRRELADALVGGRIQRVVLPDERSVGLEVYAGKRAHQLLFHVDPARARAHLVAEKLKRGVEHASPLLLLLRKYVRGGRLLAIRQPPLERILTFDISYSHPDTDETGTVTLVFEAIGRQSNLILLDSAGVIMDSQRRVGPGMSRHRQIVSHRQYIAPAPLDRPAPAAITPGQLEAAAAEREAEPAWRVLLGAVAGVSPLLAREAIHRAGFTPTAAAAEVVDWSAVIGPLQAIVEAVETGPPEAWLAREDGVPVAYAAYELTAYPRRERSASISAAIVGFPSQSSGRGRAGETDRRRNLRRRLEDSRRRAEARLISLRRAAEQGEEADRLRKAGELLLARQHEVPARATEARLDGVTIDLAPQLTAVQNAQALFKRYRSARAAADRSPRALRKAELDLAFLEQTILDAGLAGTDPELRAIEELLDAAGGEPAPVKRSRRRRAEPPGPRRFDIEGWPVLVGRNAAQNHAITFREANPDDLWLHARGVPGAHVVLRAGGRAVPEDVITTVAGIAAHYGASSADAAVEVDVTERRNVRPIRGAGPGQVTYRGERTLRVPPYDPSTRDTG
ncbi:MAG: NFACT RNA binding domain-containing protein [Chloroflexota bacterium]|nr:NFACT RNA binding domain-containing protein [Chloroflexota bacterium]